MERYVAVGWLSQDWNSKKCYGAGFKGWAEVPRQEQEGVMQVRYAIHLTALLHHMYAASLYHIWHSSFDLQTAAPIRQ